jgi:hypothetical protein
MDDIGTIAGRNVVALRPGTLPADLGDGRLPVVALSQAAAEAVALATRNASSAAPPVALYASPAIREEAKRRADAIQQRLSPVGESRALEWLLEVGELVTIPERVDLAASAKAMAKHLADLPAGPFHSANAARMAASHKFWPNFAEVRAFILGRVAPIRAELLALRDVEAAPDRPERDDSPVDPEHVQRQVADLRASLARARAESGDAPAPVTPRRLSSVQLLAAYREQIAAGRGNVNAAAVRVAMLERQLRQGGGA